MTLLPEWVRESARSLLGLVDRDVPLADLTFDSLLDGADDADPAAPRRLLFVSQAGVTIAVSMQGPPSALVADLQITPSRRYDVVVQQKSAPATKAATDEAGLVTLPSLRSGLTSLTVSPQGHDSDAGCRTAWVVY